MNSVTRDFQYTGLKSTGEEARGSVVAASETDARRQLASDGVFVLDFKPQSRARLATARVNGADLALGLRMLANLVDSGMPITQSLNVFRELAPGSWLSSLHYVERSVAGGEPVSAALGSATPLGFPATAVGLIRAGEAGAGLSFGLNAAADWAETRAADAAALRAALAYPAVVATVGLITVGVMVGWILPRFAAMLADLGQTPPRLASLVLQFAEIARNGAIPAVALLIAGSVTLTAFARTEEGKRGIHELLLRLPLFGQVRFSSTTSRVLAALSAMLRTGVPLPAAIELAGSTSGDLVIEKRLLAARDMLTSGQTLAKSLSVANAVSSTASRIVAAGEESGGLVTMLSHAAEMERARAQLRTRQLLRVLEPTLLLVVSGTVGVIASAMLQAIYSIRPAQ